MASGKQIVGNLESLVSCRIQFDFNSILIVFKLLWTINTAQQCMQCVISDHY